MKKGLRNTIASLALSGMSLFGGIKQANAGWIDSEEKAQTAAEQVFKDAKFESTWTKEDIDGMRAEAAVEAVKAKEMLPTLLKLIAQKNGIDFSKMKEVTLTDYKEDGWSIEYPGQFETRVYADGRILSGSEFCACEGTQYVVNPQKGTFLWSKLNPDRMYTISSSKELEMGKGKDLKALSQERALKVLNYNRIGLGYGTNVFDNVMDNVSHFYQKNGLTETPDLEGGITFLFSGSDRYEPMAQGVLIRHPKGKTEGYRLGMGGELSNIRLEVKDGSIFQQGEDGKLDSMDDFFKGAMEFDFDKGTLELSGVVAVPFGNMYFDSPKLSIATGKAQTKAKTVSPSVRKAISDRLQKQ